jgi:thiol-disulfide isomerase/thioredoxin
VKKIITFGFLTFVLFSCKNNSAEKDVPIKNVEITKDLKNQVFDKDWNALTKNWDAWYNYTYYNIKLSEDFIGLDVDSKEISKETLLNNLINKNVVAFKTKIVNDQPVYKLFAINSTNEGIKNVSKQSAALELKYFKKEGKDLPNFNFKDLKGKVYNKENMKGKIFVLKCWFIGCTTCVAEFPELNKLVDKYADNKDIVFVSLALDKDTKLNKFLKAKEFKYATVPNMKNFIAVDLGLTMFPTHILVGRDGKMKKFVNRITDFVPYLEKEIGGK